MKKLLMAVLFGLLCSEMVSADASKIADSLSKVIPTVSAANVTETAIKGLYQVDVGGRIIYASEDGRYIIQGEMVDLQSRTNVTEQALKKVRLAALEKVDSKTMIIFPAQNPQHTLTIFSDIDCGYCRKLHADLKSYNDAGISVRYLLFPRSGPNTESYHKAVSVWCASDRNQALTDAKLNDKVVSKTCDSPIDENIQLAQAFAVNGTPTMIADDGTLVPGFVPANELLKHLGW
ncbi:MAG: DsbC family protein [Cycloclasticus sp.]|nr:DsbC family protein [Cycloclasticus sp.]MBQ0789692.1 DsbC family protein [Cycloclasticus sp.]